MIVLLPNQNAILEGEIKDAQVVYQISKHSLNINFP